jgi:hypothetical protein
MRPLIVLSGGVWRTGTIELGLASRAPSELLAGFLGSCCGTSAYTSSRETVWR